MIEQQRDDINLLESENAEQGQEIELLRTKTNNQDIGLAFRKTDGIDIGIEIGTTSGFDIDTTSFDAMRSPVINVEDDIAMAIPNDDDMTDNENDNNSDGSDLETGPNYRILHMKSMEAMNDYRSQIIALKQQLFDEQRKREELEKEIELKMQQEMRDSMIRRQSREQDYYHANNMMDHVQIKNGNNMDYQDRDDDGIPLLIKENDDASSPDELQPFVVQDKEDNNIVVNIKKSKSDDMDDKTPKCCRFLFGIC